MFGRAQSPGGGKITRLHLCRRVRSSSEYPGHDTEQSDDEAPVMLELWEKWITPSLASLSGPLWLRLITFDRFLSMGQTELLDIKTKSKQMTKAKLHCLK